MVCRAFAGPRMKKYVGRCPPTVAIRYVSDSTVLRIGNWCEISALIVCRFPTMYLDLKFQPIKKTQLIDKRSYRLFVVIIGI